MREAVLKILPEIARETHTLILDSTNNNSLKIDEKRTIGEATLALGLLSESKIVVPHEKIILERAFNYGFNILYDELSLFYFSSYHYSYRNVVCKGLSKAQQELQKTNLDTMAMLIKIKAYQMKFTGIGNSTDSYFFSRMDKLLKAIRYVIETNKNDLYIPCMYNLCNLHQTLCYYISCGDNKFQTKAKALLSEAHILLNKAIEERDIINLIGENIQLKLFIDSQFYIYDQMMGKPCEYPRYNLKYDAMDKVQILRVLTSYHLINKDAFKKEFGKAFWILCSNLHIMLEFEKILFLKVIMQYILLVDDYEPIELGLFEPFDPINLSLYMNEIFNGYNEIYSSNISPDDLDILYSLTDNELRQKIAKTIKSVDPVVLEREARKPHGSFEISDMEFQLILGGVKTFVCVPFKSGREITRGSVPENVIHQIIRPFINFRRCVVIFITARTCSQNLMNYIRKLQDQFNWPIEVIQERELAGLLKVNALLSRNA